MINIIKTLILDFQEMSLDIGTKRHLQVQPLAKKAAIYIGVRRSGKSTFLMQIIQNLIDSGVSRQNIFYLNFFDDRLRSLEQTGLAVVTEAYYGIYPEKKNSEMVYFFFDEIQEFTAWEAFIDRLLRTEKCQIYISGSSARMLSTEIATAMRGRALSWELFPFSFKEFLDFKGIKYQGSLSTQKRLLVQKSFEEYWQKGGFPEVFELSHDLRVKIHQEYVHYILFRDLIERHDISHPNALIDLVHRLLDNAGSLYSINSVTGYLKSLNHKAPKAVVSDYLVWLEDAYFLFSVHLFDSSATRRKMNPKKIYCIDHALVRSVSSCILVNAGHLLENLVFVALRAKFEDVYYYKTKSGKEVDFITPGRRLFQVCQTLSEPQTRKRELAALSEAMAELGVTESALITYSETEQVTVAEGTVEIIPVWRFLLDT